MKPGHRADCSCCLFWSEEKDETPIDTTPTPVICERCGVTMEWGMFPWCKGSPADHGSGLKQHIFSPVEVDLGKEGKVVLSSVMDARRLERESEKRAANGEGQQIVFRAFTQDKSNYDRNSLGENPRVPFRTRNRRGQPFITRRGGDYKG